ncbi:hypothetical protein U0070_025505 [Myodes glareolus]|uniref:Uncharacterized protein n=1 Tax=Myodes glareolus TaxID=447135 RepID=A0AAW0HSA4_MYOGA
MRKQNITVNTEMSLVPLFLPIECPAAQQRLPPELSMASDARWNGHAQLPGYSAEKENSLLLPGAQSSSSQPQSQQYRQHSKGRV